MTQLRVGLIGAGGISHAHVAAWQSIGAQVTVYSLAGAPELAERYGLNVADELHELLALVDVVDVVTPSSTHKAVVLAAIEAGKNLVCEKPLAATSADAAEIIQAADAAGVQVYPAHVVRYFPEYEAIKAQIDAGRIGTPAVLRFTRAGQAPRSGSWFFSEPDGGGIILDQMIHDLDQATWMAGEVTQVFAVQNPSSVDGVTPGIVTAQVVLSHAGGAISHIQGTWGPAGMTFATSVEVAGSGGILSYRSPDDGAVRLDLPSAQNSADYLPPTTHAESPYALEVREFAAAFAGGPTPRVSANDGLIAIALAEAAAESVRTGRAVQFDEKAVLA